MRIAYQVCGGWGRNKDEHKEDLVPDTRWVDLSELVENMSERNLTALDAFCDELKQGLKRARASGRSGVPETMIDND